MEKDWITPPTGPEIQRGAWMTLPNDDPVSLHWLASLDARSGQPPSWEVARLSNAVFLYRELQTGNLVAAKFYTIKTPNEPQRYAAQEACLTRHAGGVFSDQPEIGIPCVVDVWRGALFLEYIEGLTLEDLIAIRRRPPGILPLALARAGRALASLHALTAASGSSETGEAPETHKPPGQWEFTFGQQIEYAHKMVSQLAEFGVLQDEPLISGGLEVKITAWAGQDFMQDYRPAWIHGDATTTNFIFPFRSDSTGQQFVDGAPAPRLPGESPCPQPAGDFLGWIDWERAKPADPAADLGRLLAEVSYSVHQHGGSGSEALPLLELLQTAYLQALPAGWDHQGIQRRAVFYQAVSNLRIARNGWVSSKHRLGLVGQAFGLLANL